MKKMGIWFVCLAVLMTSLLASCAPQTSLTGTMETMEGNMGIESATQETLAIPEVEGWAIAGVPIGEFTIAADKAEGWDIFGAANALAAAIETLSGEKLPVVRADVSDAEHEIYLALASSTRDLPFTTDEAHCGIYDGDLYIYGTTPMELQDALTLVMETCFSEKAADDDVAKTLPEVTLFSYEEQVITVSPEAGSLEAGLQDAMGRMKEAADAGKHTSIVVELSDGAYSIAEPIVLDGTDIVPGYTKLNIRAAEGAFPAINGLKVLDSSAFQKVEGQEYYVYQFAPLSDGSYPVFHDFYDNGERIDIASSELSTMKIGFDVPGDREHPQNFLGPYLEQSMVEKLGELTYPVEFVLYDLWEASTMLMTGVDTEDTKIVNDVALVRAKIAEEQWNVFVKQVNFADIHTHARYFFRNHPSLLKPGTWAYDITTGTLYYYPAEGAPVSPAFSDVESILSLKSMDRVTFSGITFTGTGYGGIAQEGYMSGQANTRMSAGLTEVLPASALLLGNCSNIKMEDCRLVDLGTNGVQAYDRLIGIDIRNCLFEDISMSAIALGNHTTAWDEDNAVYNIHIENNVIHNIAMEYPTATAIYISHVDKVKILHNTISDMAYSAISIGWGWVTVGYNYGDYINVRHADIAYNRILNHMMLLQDGGAVYVLGGNVNTEYTEYFNFIHDNYAERDRDGDDTIRGYYLDGAASNWEVYNNVTLGARQALFAQCHAEIQYAHNDYLHNNYVDYKLDGGNHSKARNVTAEDNVVYIRGKESMWEKEPAAVVIYEDSGADWSVAE